MPTKTALITGVNGQDGSFLAELLLQNHYIVHGVLRKYSPDGPPVPNLSSVWPQLNSRLFLHACDLRDSGQLRQIIELAQPDEVYNLAAQSNVGDSFENLELTIQSNGMAVFGLLEAVKDYGRQSGKKVRLLQAGSSQMFGKAPCCPQDENTPLHPLNPYACAKAFAHMLVVQYRETYGLFACNAICFNHESPRRDERFVTRKITRSAARIKLGLQSKLLLGNLDAQRDWGFAGDYVNAMWCILQQDSPQDFVIATGVYHTVGEFLAAAFVKFQLDWREFVEIDPRLYRPSEADKLLGNPAKARQILGWSPQTDFFRLVEIMAAADMVEGSKPGISSGFDPSAA